jgi:hypothetical protein
MAAKSNHYGDLIKWVEECIDSSTSHQHIKSNGRLINSLFYKLTSQVSTDMAYEIRRSLRSRLDNKHISIIRP